MPPVQVAVPFGSEGQGVQREPQVAGESFGTQAPLQRWNPEAQEIPHAPLVQVAVPFAVVGQGVQREPQVAGESSRTHAPEHS